MNRRDALQHRVDASVFEAIRDRTAGNVIVTRAPRGSPERLLHQVSLKCP
jgi:hypothetical protein